MKNESLLIWRFTLENRFTLEEIPEVFCVGNTYRNAEIHLRELFSDSLYDIKDVCNIRNRSLIVVGVSNFKSLVS